MLQALGRVVAGGGHDDARGWADASTTGVVRPVRAVRGFLSERPVRHGDLDMGGTGLRDAAGAARVLGAGPLAPVEQASDFALPRAAG